MHGHMMLIEGSALIWYRHVTGVVLAECRAMVLHWLMPAHFSLLNTVLSVSTGN